MRKIYILLLVFFANLLANTIQCQNTVIKAHAGPEGIWVIAGNTFNKSGHIEIWRKSSDNFSSIAKLYAPVSREEISARISDIIKLNIGFRQTLQEQELNFIWKEVKAGRTDSLGFYRFNYPVLYAIGLAWYDKTCNKNIRYTYKITQTDKNNKVITENTTETVSFPGVKTQAAFELQEGKSTGDAISIRYLVTNPNFIHHALVYRSYYLRSGFELIDPGTIFMKEKDKIFLHILDKTVTPKVPYSYFAVAVDAAGNRGDSSEVFNLFNVPPNALPPSVERIYTYSLEKEKAIRVSWKISNIRDIVSIDIYKSMIHDGRYFKVASAAPDDTAYMDYNVVPIQNYFYTIVLNGSFQNSPNSPRIGGMLQASEDNLLPVNNFDIHQNGNVVKLSWNRAENDTRAYYIYRATTADGELGLIGAGIESDSNYIEASDTLPTTQDDAVYAYAIRDINTSYKIGPFSGRMLAYASGAQSNPIPTGVELQKLGSKKVWLVWNNLESSSNSVNGYEVTVREVDMETKKETPNTRVIALPTLMNQFTDSNLRTGFQYFYSVRSIAINGSKSSPSLEVGYEVFGEDIAGVSDMRLFTSNGQVEISWVNPGITDMKNVRIERAEKNQKAQVITTLSDGETSFIDTKVEKNKEYYYYIYVVNKAGSESEAEGPVGVRVR